LICKYAIWQPCLHGKKSWSASFISEPLCHHNEHYLAWLVNIFFFKITAH
jgi:hypothetical protein